MPPDKLTNPYILWDSPCNPIPQPCGEQNFTVVPCSQTQTWFWIALGAIFILGVRR
jgi:hypothetical protein